MAPKADAHVLAAGPEVSSSAALGQSRLDLGSLFWAVGAWLRSPAP